MPCAVLCCAMLQVRLFNQTLSLTLCNPMDLSPPDSSVHGILQARILEWVVMPSSGDLPDPGIEPATLAAPASQADSLPLSHQGSLKSAGEMILAIGTVPCHSNCKMILCLPPCFFPISLTGAPGKMPLLSM